MLEEFNKLNIENGMRVLVRSSLNAPVVNGEVDTLRIQRSSETLNDLKNKGAKVVVIAHLGRDGESLETISKALQQFTPHTFVKDLLGDRAKDTVSKMKDGDVVLLENLRQDKREEQKSQEFAKEIAKYGDVFVLDAFSDAHRDHSSISVLPTILPSYSGIQYLREVKTLKQSLSPNSPSVCILGGAKLHTKAKTLLSLIDKYDEVFVGGVLANTLLFHKGIEIGNSIVEKFQGDKEVFEKLMKHTNLHLPSDVIVKQEDKVNEVNVNEISSSDKIIDVGENFLNEINQSLLNAETVLWNGPLGIYELGVANKTTELAKLVANSKAYSIVGGGDTIAAIKEVNAKDDISFISTGGGAMLEFLANDGKFDHLN